MMKKNKGKRVLTAVGAVVAAGLTPGFIAASAAGSSIQGPSAGTTAAEAVVIDGKTYEFDELFAMQQPDSVAMEEIVLDIVLEPDTDFVAPEHTIAYKTTKYGVPIAQHYRKINDSKDDESVIYRSVEQMPRFPGGEAALMKYIKAHIQYPAEALKNRIKGHVVVQFVVERTGKIGEVKVVRSVDKDLDKEAIRVVKSLPKFTPGRQNGQDVSVWYTLPVTFTLPEE